MERFQMNGKVAIITGGAQGFGQEISENLSIQAGLKVVIADLQKDRGTALAREIEGKGGEALFVETDICDVESIDRLMRQTKGSFWTA